MAHHFYICGILYSIINGKIPEIREIRCKFVSGRLYSLIKKCRNFVLNKKKIENENLLINSNENLLINFNENLPIISNEFNLNKIINYFNFYKIPIIKSIPKIILKEEIQKNLEFGYSCLKLGDKEQSLVFFKNALKNWK